MTRKIIALADYVSAHDAAQILSLKHARPIQPKYIRTLAKSKRQPIRYQRLSNRLLYLRADIEQCVVKQKQTHYERDDSA
jgi:hypothetical protein